MPPRWLCVAIVAFWLSTNGWLLHRDLWPYLQPNQPPPMSLDLTDEVQQRHASTLWTVYQDGKKVFQAKTVVEHPTPDLYELHSEFKHPPNFARADLPGFYLERLASTYRIDPEGKLKGVEVSFTLEPRADFLKALLPQKDSAISALVRGEVKDDEFYPVVEAPGSGFQPYKLAPVKIPSGAGLLQPLHPLKRMRNLRPGQHWIMPVLDPMALFHAAVSRQKPETRDLVVDVRPKMEEFSTGKRQPVPCLVVDYRNDDMTVSMWVDERTGQVLRQEADLYGKKWVMERD